MITIQIGKGVKFHNLPELVREKMMRDLTFDNPKYKSAKAHGTYMSASLEPKIKFYTLSMDKEVFWTPRGYVWFAKRWLRRHGYKSRVIDNTLTLPEIDIEFQGDLRDYQDPAVYDITNRYPVGVLEAATGAGKTVMGTGIIAERKQPTLVIVHNKELLYQWRDAIKKFIGYDCGLLGDSKKDIKPITVGIINSVKNHAEMLAPQFGHIVIDECHRCPSTTWTETLSVFPAKHYLGLSATPFRKDGLGNAIYAHIGPKIHKVDKDLLHESGAVLKPQIFTIPTTFRPGSFAESADMAYSTIIQKLVTDKQRNKLISRTVYNDFKKNNDNVLIVSDRVTHCTELAILLEEMGIATRVLSGKAAGRMELLPFTNEETNEVTHKWVMNKAKRNDTVDDVKNGKCKVLIATLSLIGEGFDAPNLTSLHLTTPIKFSGRVIQTVGRVLRPEKGKVPRVFDYRDDNVRTLQISGFTRNKIYKEQKWW